MGRENRNRSGHSRPLEATQAPGQSPSGLPLLLTRLVRRWPGIHSPCNGNSATGPAPFSGLSPGPALLGAQEAEGSVCPDPLGLQGLDGHRLGCGEFRFLSPVKTSRRKPNGRPPAPPRLPVRGNAEEAERTGTRAPCWPGRLRLLSQEVTQTHFRPVFTGGHDSFPGSYPGSGLFLQGGSFKRQAQCCPFKSQTTSSSRAPACPKCQ